MTNLHLEKLVTSQSPNGPVLVVVADGVGIAPSGPSNAVALANTPVMDELLSSEFSTQLQAHGVAVGLPSDDDMGNSEVGHNALGAGRIFAQGAKLVNQAFDEGTIFENENWLKVQEIGQQGGTVHFLGLLSDGNVHSHIDHLINLINRCNHQGINSVAIHVLLDGRDVDPRSALIYVQQLEDALSAVNLNPDRNYRIASGGGRMTITMDRYDADWPMVQKGYHCHIHGTGMPVASCAAEITRQYESSDTITDQTLEPFVVVDDNGAPVGKVQSGDAVVLFNFRGDRAIEISRALEESDFTEFDRGDHPEIFYCGMLQYDGDLNIPENYLVAPPQIDRTMVEYMCAAHLRTFAVSETQKFGHVTFFWNGNRSGYFDEDLETYIEIPSDNIEFNQAPDMKAREITDATIELIESGQYKFGRINFANGDMVGHTGDVQATVQAMETVDQCIGRLVECINSQNGILIFTADHGNADEMFVEKEGKRIARTSHTLNPVPFVIVDNRKTKAYRINQNLPQPGLANVAATVFNLMGYHAPEGYCASLLEFPDEPRSRRLIHQGSIVNLGLETVKLPNNEILALEIVRHPGGAVVLAVDENNNACLIRQFRHAANGYIWEFPAGILDPNEEPLTAAQRELKEETGLNAKTWQSLGSLISTPGFCTERLYLFLATDLETGQASLEQHEVIETHWKPVSEIESMIHSGEIDDAKTIVTLFRALNKL